MKNSQLSIFPQNVPSHFAVLSLFFVFVITCKQPAQMGSIPSGAETTQTDIKTLPDSMDFLNTIKLFEFSSDSCMNAEKDLSFYDRSSKIIRCKEVRLNPEVVDRTIVKPGRRILVELFDNTWYLAEVQSVEENIHNTLTIKTFVPMLDLSFILTTHAGRSVGTLAIPSQDRYYEITSHPQSNIHYLIEIKHSDLDIIEDM